MNQPRFKTKKEFIIYRFLMYRNITRNFALRNYISTLREYMYKFNKDLVEELESKDDRVYLSKKDKDERAFETENIPVTTPWGTIGHDYKYKIKDKYYTILYLEYSYLLTDEEQILLACNAFEGEEIGED